MHAQSVVDWYNGGADPATFTIETGLSAAASPTPDPTNLRQAKASPGLA